MAQSPLFAVIGAVGLLVGLFLILIYNRLAGGRNAVRQAYADVYVHLKRRLDLIPNLVTAVKAALDHEKSVLVEVTEKRNEAIAARGPEDVAIKNGQLGQALAELKAVVEAYPEVKANNQVRDLMEELTSTENRISFCRQAYNDLVRSYNDQLDLFPSNLVAGWFAFRRAVYLQFEEGTAKVPKVDLS